MADVIDLHSRNPLLGTWKASDGFSDVQYTVSASAGKILVTGVDVDDGEKIEIRDVSWDDDKGVLTFNAYIPSTGRTLQYHLRQAPATGRAMVTYTYTAQETWELV